MPYRGRFSVRCFINQRIALRRAFFCATLLLGGSGTAQSLFTDVTQEVIGKTLEPAWGHAFGDYDNDGWPDLAHAGPVMRLLHNREGRQFEEYLADLQTDLPWGPRGGPLFGDYDNDGDLDLFVAAGLWVEPAANLLWRNDRGTFREVTVEAGLTDVLPTSNSLWLDYDRDGDLDLYTGNLGAPEMRNILYRNNGDGTFVDATDEAGLDLQFHPEAGGSNGGMAAGDFDDDGWPDLYIGVFRAANQLFLNNGQGGFVNVTSDEIADIGEASGIAVGDIDNDGDLDIIQIAGNTSPPLTNLYRGVVLKNEGDGRFLTVTAGVGLGELEEVNAFGIGMADFDNDGDLDLLIARPQRFFANDGNGNFSDRTSQSGITDVSIPTTLGDYDLDGFIDVIFGGDDVGFLERLGGLYHNNGNANHWLRVELVGIRSNTSGIGARLTAAAGDLHQMREILGGRGFEQDEMVAHFGLGSRDRVDRLEIRWPSGQIDIVRDIPADRKIRVFEGREEYHVVQPSRWESRGLSDTTVVGARHEVRASVWPALFEPGAQITQVVADLSAFGGSSALQMVEAEEGRYELETALEVDGPKGFRQLSVLIEQSTSRGPHWIRLAQRTLVLPAADLVIFSDALAEAWSLEMDAGSAEAQVYNDRSVLALQTPAFWNAEVRPAQVLELSGYTHLQFAFHPGASTVPRSSTFSLVVNGRNDRRVVLLRRRTFDDIGIDMEVADWQLVKIPLDVLVGGESIASIRFSGNLEGAFYLDDIRLVAAQVPPSTAVLEEHFRPLPRTFALKQNFPNPFNSGTVIRFSLPTSSRVDLALYNLVGQKVAELVEGRREAGTHTLRWDGRDDEGRELASGVYLYRLRSGTKVETRKLLLVR